MVTMQVVFCHLFWEEQIQTWIFWWFVQDEFGFTLISSKNPARYCHGTIHHPIENVWPRLPSSYLKIKSETCYSLIFWLYRVLRNLLDAFFGLGIIFRVWEGQHRSGFVLGGYSVLHLFFEVLHGLKSDFTNDLYKSKGSLWIFWIRDRYRTMDYPWLFMKNSILSAFQVILCIVENLENCILIVVS